jgi:ribosomal protein L29
MAPILYGIPDTLILVLSSQPGNAPCRPGARSQERPHLKTETGEHLKPRSQYADEAVQLAIAGKWDEAVKLNRTIIEDFGADEETQNRLGKALSELGKLKDAKASYEAALKLNPMNSIAKKNAARINTLLHQKEGLKVGGTRVDLNLFVEEMGKTIITALEGASPDICSKVAAGDVAELKIDHDGIVAETSRGVRLGTLEAKLARRLIKFMRGGNRYQGGVTACDGSTVKLIVRETYQDPKFVGKPSFAMRRKREVEFRPYTKESLLSRDVEVFAGEDDEEEPLVAAAASDDLEEGMHAVEDEAEPVDFSEEANADGDDEDEDDS